MEVVNEILANVKKEVIYPLMALGFGIALVWFLWGMVKFIKNPDSEEERKKGQQNMQWGIIGFVIMSSAVGLYQMVKNIVLGL